MHRRRFLTLAAGATAALALPACVAGPAVGPPPHAPAHGYRHKYGSTVLVYDSGPGIYLVSGRPDHYYYGGHYYRPRGRTWYRAVALDGPWQPAPHRAVPPGLRGSGPPGRGHGRGRR
jgi:hypothetical protein